jgi:hypothetical protein
VSSRKVAKYLVPEVLVRPAVEENVSDGLSPLPEKTWQYHGAPIRPSRSKTHRKQLQFLLQSGYQPANPAKQQATKTWSQRQDLRKLSRRHSERGHPVSVSVPSPPLQPRTQATLFHFPHLHTFHLVLHGKLCEGFDTCKLEVIRLEIFKAFLRDSLVVAS